MDPVSVRLVRASLLWLVAGFTLGALMLSDALVPGDWRLWFAPTHGHILFVGWFLQFALGIAYWLLPRKRTEVLPLGYREGVGIAGAGALNAGLALRVLAEPLERGGHASDLTLTLLAGSAALQIVAVALFVSQLWPRIYGRGKLGKPAGRGASSNA
jgi:hypothetical protein